MYSYLRGKNGTFEFITPFTTNKLGLYEHYVETFQSTYPEILDANLKHAL